MNDPLPKPAVAPSHPHSEWSDVVVSIPAAIAEIKAGRMIVLVDDEDRENEGDLTMAADAVTPEAINFMAMHGRGLICLPMLGEQLEKLRLGMMVPENENSSGFGTAFTISIEAREGVTTGISAHDRAHTILTAIRGDARPQDIVRPGHVFPLRARAGGVLRRAGQTEGAVDLSRLAGRNPSGVICEIMNDDGTMARMPDLVRFARKHGLKIATIADLIEYRLRNEKLVRPAGDCTLPTRSGGEFRAIV
jgi:3,4-dihydroxy 2-butanone 4-phosphate synthase / GTP cyclohydrolase II